jgi:hypothetical protein
MVDSILQTTGKPFQKFILYLSENLSKPKAKFVTELLCGILFCDDLILTHIASKVPNPSRLPAIAKRFRRQLSDDKSFPKQLWFNYLAVAARRLGPDSLFIVDLSDGFDRLTTSLAE